MALRSDWSRSERPFTVRKATHDDVGSLFFERAARLTNGKRLIRGLLCFLFWEIGDECPTHAGYPYFHTLNLYQKRRGGPPRFSLKRCD